MKKNTSERVKSELDTIIHFYEDKFKSVNRRLDLGGTFTLEFLLNSFAEEKSYYEKKYAEFKNQGFELNEFPLKLDYIEKLN